MREKGIIDPIIDGVPKEFTRDRMELCLGGFWRE